MYEPMNPYITILAIQNPGRPEAVIIRHRGALSPPTVITKHSAKIEHGAFVSLTERDIDGNTRSVSHFIADRTPNQLYLQNNDYMQDDTAPAVNEIGAFVAGGIAKPIQVELETFTIFGKDDNDEVFVTIVDATEDTARDGFGADVIIFKGDQSELEIVSS